MTARSEEELRSLREHLGLNETSGQSAAPDPDPNLAEERQFISDLFNTSND